MNKLLIEESPLQVLPSLAVLIGLNEALILQQIQYWLNINEKSNKNFIKNRYWTYNTYNQWKEQFPFWSQKTIGRTIRNLESKNLVISKYFKAGDRTKWYTINYKELEEIQYRKGQNGTTIRTKWDYHKDKMGLSSITETSQRLKQKHTVSKETDDINQKDSENMNINDIINKKENISELRKDYSENINNINYQEILNKWNSISGVHKHKIDKLKPSKTILKFQKYISLLMSGDFISENTNITDSWLKQRNIPADWKNKKWTYEEIMDSLDRFALQWQPGYWPYTREDKQKMLSKSIAGFLYNAYGKFPSPFLNIMANKPELQRQHNKKVCPDAKNLKFSETMYKYFVEFYDGETADKLIPDIVEISNSLLDKHTKIIDLLSVIYRENGSWHSYVRSPISFMTKYIEWLNDRYTFTAEFPLMPGYFKTTGKTWKSFVREFKMETAINLEPTEKELNNLEKRYGIKAANCG